MYTGRSYHQIDRLSHRLAGLNGMCIGCKGCQGLCASLIELLMLPEAVLKNKAEQE